MSAETATRRPAEMRETQRKAAAPPYGMAVLLWPYTQSVELTLLELE